MAGDGCRTFGQRLGGDAVSVGPQLREARTPLACSWPMLLGCRASVRNPLFPELAIPLPLSCSHFRTASTHPPISAQWAIASRRYGPVSGLPFRVNDGLLVVPPMHVSMDRGRLPERERWAILAKPGWVEAEGPGEEDVDATVFGKRAGEENHVIRGCLRSADHPADTTQALDSFVRLSLLAHTAIRSRGRVLPHSMTLGVGIG